LLEQKSKGIIMKQGIHPELHAVVARCACGNSFPTSSTKDEVRATICSNCHPYFTGAEKFVDTAGRIEKFEQRYKKFKKGS
jgi:large subunit ribosomal protein L31